MYIMLLLLELMSAVTLLLISLFTMTGSGGCVPNPAVAGSDEGEAEGCRDGSQLAEAEERGPHEVRMHFRYSTKYSTNL